MGNIVFGGLIGLVLDAVSGGMYRLEPRQVNGNLAAGVAALEGTKDVLLVGIVMDVDPSWEKVGQLERE